MGKNYTVADYMTALNVLQEKYNKLKAEFNQDTVQAHVMARTLVTIIKSRLDGKVTLRKDKINDIGSKWVVDIQEDENTITMSLITPEEFVKRVEEAKRKDAEAKAKKDAEAKAAAEAGPDNVHQLPTARK